MALKPISEMVAALKAMPLPGILPARIGEATPKTGADLPTLRVAPAELDFSPLGIGGFSSVHLDDTDTWVEERGRRINGSVNVEAWAADEDTANALAVAVAEGLAKADTELLGRGFLKLRQSRWLPAEETALRSEGGGTALKRTLVFDMVFEDIETVASGPGGPIVRIDVRIQPPFEEGMDLGKT
jgi:hypothetical protein